MTDSLFREGGPHNIRRTGPHQITMNISLPADANGRVARECPDAECSPGYFKVKNGTGIIDGPEKAYCPYCRRAEQPNDFATQEQIRYGGDLMMEEASQGIDRMMHDKFELGSSGRRRIGGGLVSVDMSYKPAAQPSIRIPFEEAMQRDVVCPHCGLDHVVFGLAIWCADCGRDIFLTHVRAEYGVIRKMLGDVDRRREELGPRVAARDIENALEDAVSIYEGTLKAMIARYLRQCGSTEDDIQTILKKDIANRCQSIPRSIEVVERFLDVALLEPLSEAEEKRLRSTFEKRHPITHNLGVVDRKYLERARSAEREGREVRVTSDEIAEAIDACIRLIESLQSRLFPITE